MFSHSQTIRRLSIAGLFLGLWYGLSSNARVHDHDWDGRQFLEAMGRTTDLQKRVVRVLIGTGPNLGLQSTSVGIVRRIQEMQFEGDIEIVSDPENLEKLAILFPEFHPDQGHDQRHGALRFRIIPFHSLPRHLEPVRFGLTGGFDDLTFSNLAVKLNCDYFLSLQPMDWASSSSLHERSTRVYDPQSLPSLSQMGFSLEHVVKEAMADEKLAELSDFKDARDALRRTKGLRYLQSQLPHRNIMPVYGLGTMIGSALTRIATFAGYSATLTSYELPTLRPGGLIVPVFSQGAQAAGYETLFRNLPESLKSELGVRWSGNPPRFSLASIDDEHLAESIEGMQAGDVKFVMVGPAPVRIFNQFVLKSNFMPVIEGKGLSSLMRASGRGFMTINEVEISTLRPKYGQHLGFRMWKSASEALNTDFPCEWHDLMNAAYFARISADPRTDGYKYFQKLRQDATDITQDKFIQGMRLLADQIIGELAPGVAHCLKLVR